MTAEQLARELGLSRTTVSMVLRGEAERRHISRATADRIMTAAQRHDYVPNRAARLLRRNRRRTDVIGVLLPNFRFDWAERVMTGLLDQLEPTRYTPFVVRHRYDPAVFAKEIDAAVRRRDDALICHPLPGFADLYERLAAGPMPVILLGDRPVDATGLSSVVWDAAPAAAVAVRHLIDLGRQRIGLLGIDYPMEMGDARVAAYQAELRAAGLPVNPDWAFAVPATGPIEPNLHPALDRMFDGPGTRPDALFVLNNGVALPVLDELLRRGLSVPGDVAVIGMGDPSFAGNALVGLSTVAEPTEQMGRAAAEVAVQLIRDPLGGPVHRIVPCVDLHARRSTIGADRVLGTA